MRTVCLRNFFVLLGLAAIFSAVPAQPAFVGSRVPAEAVSIGPYHSIDACKVLKDLQPVMSNPIGLTRATALLAYVKAEHLPNQAPSIDVIAAGLNTSLIQLRTALVITFAPAITSAIQKAF